MTMAGHDSDLTTGLQVVSARSGKDVNQASRINGTKELPSQAIWQENLTPAAVLELGLDPENPVYNLDFNDSLDLVDWDSCWDSCFSSAVGALEAYHESKDFDGERPEEEFLDSAFDVSASSCCPNTHDGFPEPEIQITSGQEPKTASQHNNVDTAELFFDDWSEFFGSSGSPSHDINGSLPASFDLPDNPSGLNFLQSLQLVGGETQPAMSPDVGYSTQQLPHPTSIGAIRGHESRRLVSDASPSTSRVASAGSSEPNPGNESHAELTNSRRHDKRDQGVATRRQSASPRTQRNRTYVENRAYTPLKQAPKTWDIFEYTKDGELDPSRLFSPEEIKRYLFDHPLHQGHRDLKESQLILRVHKTPASSAKKFPNGLRCRFKDCPMRTINQGQLLVVADELSVQYPDHDFFLNAAYFHLYCIERFLNFPEICAKLNVSAEGRNARKEEKRKNRFCLSLGQEESVVQDFVEANRSSNSQPITDRRRIGGNPWVAHLPRPVSEWLPSPDQSSLPYKGTLSHQLFLTKLHYGGRGRINLRKNREARAGYEGSNITRHLGDLKKEAKMRQYSRRHKNQNQLKTDPKTERWYRADDEAEEEEQHSEPSRPQRHQPPAVIGPNQAHGTKRDRDEPEGGQTLDQDIAQAHKKPRHHGSELKIKIPEYDPRRAERGIEIFEDPMDVFGDHEDVCMATTTGISPWTTPTPKSRPLQNSRSTPIYGLPSTISEDQSDHAIELELLAAQRRRRALEIEDAKEKEKELKLKLQKADRMKRARDEVFEDGDGANSKGKRRRVSYLQSAQT